MSGVSNTAFIEAMRRRAAAQVEEYKRLVHSLHQIEMQIARGKIYLKQLNEFLEAEGQTPVILEELLEQSSVQQGLGYSLPEAQAGCAEGKIN